MLSMPKDPAQIGYIAGLLDGEGCVTKNNNCWRVQIAMTDQAVIYWLGQFGGTVRERQVKGNRQRCWRWLVMRQREVRELLVILFPLLRIKDKQARVALAHIIQREKNITREEAVADLDRLLALERLA